MDADGPALLMALVRRKGSPAALADWLLEWKPVAAIAPIPAAHVQSRTLFASVDWYRIEKNSVSVLFKLVWGASAHVQRLFHLDSSDPECGRWLAKYLNEFFIRRRKRATP